MNAMRRASVFAIAASFWIGFAIGDTGGGDWEAPNPTHPPSGIGDSADTGSPSVATSSELGFAELAFASPSSFASSGEGCGDWSWQILGGVTSSELSQQYNSLKSKHGLMVTEAWKVAWGPDPLAATWWSQPDPVPRTLAFELPNGTCASWQLSFTDDIVGERHAWIGRASDGARGSIFIIDDENGVRFAWFSFNGVQGIAASVGEETWLLRGDWLPGSRDSVEDAPTVLPATARQIFTEHHLPFVPSPPPPAGGTEIDVLVSYTTERLADSGINEILDDVAKGAS
jgi:hypothetical protein